MRTRAWCTVLLLATALLPAAACRERDASSGRERRPVRPEVHVRADLFAELQPVALANCTLERFGEPHDGGYLLCGNLLDGAAAVYSYGISGYDGFGCDVSTRVRAPLHQYDCFDVRRPACAAHQATFHEACIGPAAGEQEGRRFGTLQQQIAANGDTGKRLIVKMDVEGAEWDSLLNAPREVLDQIDQLAIELHGVDEVRFLVAVQRLKEFFHVAHLHFNNHSCSGELAPFPAHAYEVLFVNRRLATAAEGRVTRPHPLDAPNDAGAPDCQALPST
jgi:hypothetical protein